MLLAWSLSLRRSWSLSALSRLTDCTTSSVLARPYSRSACVIHSFIISFYFFFLFLPHAFSLGSAKTLNSRVTQA